MATYLEDIRVTTERNADSVRKAERTENDMFEASHSTSKCWIAFDLQNFVFLCKLARF